MKIEGASMSRHLIKGGQELIRTVLKQLWAKTKFIGRRGKCPVCIPQIGRDQQEQNKGVCLTSDFAGTKAQTLSLRPPPINKFYRFVQICTVAISWQCLWVHILLCSYRWRGRASLFMALDSLGLASLSWPREGGAFQLRPKSPSS